MILKDKRFILKQNKDLMRAIIVDIDGTISLLNNRDPYDNSKIHTDLVNTPVLDLINYYNHSAYIFFITMRPEEARKETELWFRNNHIPHNRLFMRNNDDVREDCYVKKDIYEYYIKDKYHVDFVLEDNPKVVQMYRELGLLTLEVYSYKNYESFE